MLGGVDRVDQVKSGWGDDDRVGQAILGGGRIHNGYHLLARSKPVSDNYRTQLLLEMIHPCNSSTSQICTPFERESFKGERQDRKFLQQDTLVGGNRMCEKSLFSNVTTLYIIYHI